MLDYARRLLRPTNYDYATDDDHQQRLLTTRRLLLTTPPTTTTTTTTTIISGVAHDRSEAKITVVGVPDKPGEAAAIFRAVSAAEINIDMIVQNISAAATGRTDISFTLPKSDGQTAMERAGPDPRPGRLRGPALRRPGRQGVARRRGHALAPRRLGHVLRRAGRRRRQHRDDLDLGDPDLGGRARRRTSTARSPRCTPRSSSTRRRPRRSSTAGPADEPEPHASASSAPPARSAP